MKTLRAIIVDDENLARRGLALRLQHIPQVEVVAECSNGAEALRAIAEHDPDLVFLDIQMPGMDGFEVISHLQADTMPMIVFVTAFNEYAVDAFKVNAVDYVLKPIDEERLQEAVERAIAHLEQRTSATSKEKLLQLVMGITGASASSVAEMAESGDSPKKWPEKITVKDGNDIRFIRVPEIQWVDAAGDYMCIHASGETHIMRITMKQLPGQGQTPAHHRLRIQPNSTRSPAITSPMQDAPTPASRSAANRVSTSSGATPSSRPPLVCGSNSSAASAISGTPSSR